MGALEHGLAGADHLGDAGGGVLELLVLDELVDELPARIELLVLDCVGVDGLLVLGQEHPAFDLHERGGHDEELAGQLELELAHGVEGVEVLRGDLLDGDVVDIELVLADEEQQQVERAFEDLQLDAIIGIGDGRDHGGMEADGARAGKAGMGGERWAVACCLLPVAGGRWAVGGPGGAGGGGNGENWKTGTEKRSGGARGISGVHQRVLPYGRAVPLCVDWSGFRSSNMNQKPLISRMSTDRPPSIRVHPCDPWSIAVRPNQACCFPARPRLRASALNSRFSGVGFRECVNH